MEKINIKDFACGYIQKGARNFTLLNEFPRKTYCLNISKCLQPIPFICEVNCTDKDSSCKKLFEG